MISYLPANSATILPESILLPYHGPRCTGQKLFLNYYGEKEYVPKNVGATTLQTKFENKRIAAFGSTNILNCISQIQLNKFITNSCRRKHP
jgi:hypothetical protein